MQRRTSFSIGAYILSENSGRKSLTRNHRLQLDKVGIAKRVGGRKKRSEASRQMVLTTIEMARNAGHPLTFGKVESKSSARKKSVFQVTSEVTGVTPEAVRNICKTRTKPFP